MTCPECGCEFEFPEHSTPEQTGLDALPPTSKIVCGKYGYTLEVLYELRRRAEIKLRRMADQQRRQDAKS